MAKKIQKNADKISTNTKRRPRTRSQIKPNEKSPKSESKSKKNKSSNNAKKIKTEPKPKPRKSKDENKVKNVGYKKSTTTTTNNKKQRNVAKSPKKVSKTSTKTTRKNNNNNNNKIKDSATDQEIKEIVRKMEEEEEDDETEEENDFGQAMLDEGRNSKLPIVEDHLPSYQHGFNTDTRTASSPLAKSFDQYDQSAQPQNYMSPFFNRSNENNSNNNNNVISSSSSSAFSMVPSQPKFIANHLISPPATLSPGPPNPIMATASEAASDHMNAGILHHHVPTTSLLPIPVAIPSSSSSSMNQSHQHHPHQSLLSPPQHQNSPLVAGTAGNNDSLHDLPNELLQQGWRKCWSKREGRYYFFNKVTNESVWDMPKLSNIYDPLTDPLGIQSSTNSPSFQQLPTPTDPGTPPLYPMFNPSFVSFMQNRNNEININNDKKSYLGPFDFDIESNCYIWEGLFFYYFHPHPDIEMARANFVFKLRQQYKELCKARQNLDPPQDSFTRWILERKTIDKGCDPFLPSECATELSAALYTEIMNDIPIKLIKPKFSGEARKQLSKYAEAAKKIIDHPNVSAVSRKIVKWNVEDAFEWIRKTFNATFEDYIERLEHLKRQCQPHIIEAAKSSVEQICLKIFHVAQEYARRIREMNVELFKKEDLKERGLFRFQNQKKVVCYPAYLINPCPKLPPVHMFNERESTYLRFKNGEVSRLNTQYLQKLELLYFYNCRDDRKYNLFLTRVWCLLKRYQSFYDKTEGLCSQNCLPLSVFTALNKHFGVTFECFASPLNCYFRQYCSFFPDTDGYFGSRGSILNFYPMSGSFQANPPDCEDLIDASVIHFEKLLENTMEPLSFIVFIQEKPEISTKIISKLESNKFKRMHITIPSSEHELRHGLQHICPKNEVHFKSPYNTLIYFLQNDAGFLKWGPTPERVEELTESFKIGRDNELTILSPTMPAPAVAINPKPDLEIRPNGA